MQACPFLQGNSAEHKKTKTGKITMRKTKTSVKKNATHIHDILQ